VVYFAILIQDGAAPRPFQESQTGWQLSAISKIVSEPTNLSLRLDSGYITELTSTGFLDPLTSTDSSPIARTGSSHMSY